MADLSNAVCITIGWDAATSERTFVINGTWLPGSCYDQVVMPAADFQALVTASGASSSGSSASPFTADEVTALKLQAANPSPFNLTLDEGAFIAGAVLGVWALGVAVRGVIRMFSGGESLE